MSEALLFISGILFAGVFRVSMGRIIIRENGSWCFRISRFDQEDIRVLERVNNALEIGQRAGRQDAYREWIATGSVARPKPSFDEVMK